MSNSTFYAIAKDSEGKVVSITNLSDEWVKANNEAERYCRKKSLTLEGVYKTKGKEDNNGILTKYAAERKRLRGQKGWKESGKLFFG